MMKRILITLVLSLTIGAWAQTTTQTVPSAQANPSQSETKAACPCCDKVAGADSKDVHSCCAHHEMAAKDGKEPTCCAGKDKASCCTGNEGKSCPRNKDKTASGCCSGEKSEKENKESCCAPDKKDDKTAMSCCQGEHCKVHAAAKTTN